jgi:hypothetical protein
MATTIPATEENFMATFIKMVNKYQSMTIEEKRELLYRVVPKHRNNPEMMKIALKIRSGQSQLPVFGTDIFSDFASVMLDNAILP